jgi:drug/metabolite transporter (DMT)-like permease
MAPIRAWSFTRLWAVTAVIWVVAGGAAAVADYFDAFGMAVVGLAFLPAFLAGAWAGEHPEIREWPRVRLIAMWLLLGIGFAGATDFIDHWRLAAAVAAAPATILTLRWYELLNGGPGPSLPPTTTTEPRIPAAHSGQGPAQG